MQRLVTTAAVGTSPFRSVQRPLLAENTMLAGRYRIGGVLGQGGMATVYGAWDGALERQVAVKVCSLAEYGSVSEDEARLQAGCQHPNLMPLYDAGSDSLLGISYIVMPLYPGADLGQMLNRHGAMGFRMALLCVDQICSALEFLLQRRQAIHGDIKPGNIWLTNSGAALLMDFNLYGLLARGRALRGGTPGFTAPEALAGRADSRSDVFSLGCVLYACLTGQLAFTDDAAVLRGEFVPVERLRPEIYPELAAVVHRALETDADRRYQSVREFQSDLRRPLQSIENEGALGLLGRCVRTAARLLRTVVGALYALLWRLLRRFLRHALRRPVQALIEAVLLMLMGRVLWDALLRWMRLHTLELGIGLFVGALLGVAMVVIITKRRGGRRRR